MMRIQSMIYGLLVGALILSSCQKEEQDPFAIDTNRVGVLTSETQIKALDSLFPNDSIVKNTGGTEFLSAADAIEVYEKGGAKLMIITPQEAANPKSTIESIQLIDSRYMTASGVSPASTFKTIKDAYPISKINNTLSTAVVFLDTIQAYFTIDKKELPAKFRSGTDAEITANDIPDTAAIKHFWIQWDK